jgi:hypothetical protein
MKVGSKFQTLEELSKEPLNEHRPILLINSKDLQRLVKIWVTCVRIRQKGIVNDNFFCLSNGDPRYGLPVLE